MAKWIYNDITLCLIFRQVVPADNSCLFTSINFCMSGEVGLIMSGEVGLII